MNKEIKERRAQNAARVVIINTLKNEPEENPMYRRAKLIAATPTTPPPLHELAVVFRGWVIPRIARTSSQAQA